jgi:predicted  nucleic acid-binding Zn-ribbon protein
MGLFKDVGRKVERFKQAAQDVAEEEATHRCVDCGELFYTDQDACPDCGGAVETIASEESEAETDDPEDEVTEADLADETEAGPGDDETTDADDETTDAAR